MTPDSTDILSGYIDLAEFTAERSVHDGEVVERFQQNIHALVEDNPDVAVDLARYMLLSDNDDTRHLSALCVLDLAVSRRPETALELYDIAFQDSSETVRNTAYSAFIKMLKDEDVRVSAFLPVLELVQMHRDNLAIPE